jgi:hypothetical protein
MPEPRIQAVGTNSDNQSTKINSIKHIKKNALVEENTA